MDDIDVSMLVEKLRILQLVATSNVELYGASLSLGLCRNCSISLHVLRTPYRVLVFSILAIGILTECWKKIEI